MIKLPTTLNLDSPGWVCGLCEIQFTPIPKTPKTVFVLLDICQESIVNSQTLPLLRTLYISDYNISQTSLSLIYDRVFYMPVKQQRIDQIHVHIKSTDDDLPSFADEPLRCTLHFKKVLTV